jgi:ribosome maturation factor RimP
MLDRKIIEALIDERIAELDNGLYVVDLRISPTNVIHVELDKLKGGVSVNDCVSVSRNIEHNLDREQADFELHVSSAGLDKPIRHINQFAKNVGRSFKVQAESGAQFEAELMKMNDDLLVFKQRHQVRDEVKKKKVWVEDFIELPYNQIKEAKIVISFK